MLIKIIDPALETSNGVNTDHEKSEEGLDTAIIKLASDIGDNKYWVLDSIQYSYKTSGALASVSGGVVVKDGEKVVLNLDIQNLIGSLDFYIPASPGKDLTVMLKSGGSDAIGKLNTQTHVESNF